MSGANSQPATPSPSNPVKHPPDDPRLRRVVDLACRARQLDPTGARPLHRYNNTIYLLPHEHAVARLTGPPLTAQRVRTTQQVVEWAIAERGVTATRPLPGTDPVAVDEITVGFWVHYPQPDDAALTSAHLARALLPLHRAGLPPVPLRSWTPLTSLTAALARPEAALALPDDDRDWLADHVAQVRAEVERLDWQLGAGLIHGDAWAGNLLWDLDASPDSVVLGDWDNVCVGPREVDLIPSWHAAHRYGHGQRWADEFAEIYGYDLAAWSGFDILLRMRDLVQLTGPLRRAATEPALAAGLRQRFSAIRSNDRTGVWRAF